ncbi:MAG: hypothetical protein KBC84_07415 [Proteobacteria bacterium]|nr:hypothetical protein [Pseudomonadota bacterium]
MHGLPPNLDVNFFHGKKLETIQLNSHSVILILEGAIEIAIFCPFTFNGQLVSLMESGSLDRLLDAKVISARTDSELGNLQLVFERENYLVLHDSEREYESYTFNTPIGLVVV